MSKPTYKELEKRVKELEKSKTSDNLENELKKLTEIYEHAVKVTKLGVWKWDVKTNEEFFSDEWCRVVGYEPDDPGLSRTYETWESRIHPDDLDYVLEKLKSHLEKKGTV